MVLRGGYVVTLDSELGELPDGDVRIRNGELVEVGNDLDATDSEVIDVSGCVVMPGFVDTHWHFWNTLLRGLVGAGKERAYFPVKRRLAPLFQPADSYIAARLALTEAIDAGITTAVNWDHNLRSPHHADAELAAHVESGVRVRLAYGNPDAFDPSSMMDIDDVDRVRAWLDGRSDDRLSLGVSLRGPTRTERGIMLDEWAAARERGLPITMHLGGRRADTDRYADIGAMGEDGLLGEDVQLVHAVDADARELALLAETGTSLTLSPVSELKTMDFPPLGDALEAGVQVSLSIDTLALPTTADMFEVMKLMLYMERHRDRESILDLRRVLELATIEGARDLRMEDSIGTLTPGKRADVIAVRVDGPTMSPGFDPLALVVQCGQPGDVDLVIVDGRVLKRSGEITFFDPAEISADARAATGRLLQRADWSPV